MTVGRSQAADDALRAIGAMLDRDEYPHVGTNGQVMPEPDLTLDHTGKGASRDARERTRGTEGSEARQGQGTSAGSSAQAAAEAFLVGNADLSERNRSDLGAAMMAYPSLRIRIAPPVAWLLTVNEPMAAMRLRAFMLTVVSLDPSVPLVGQKRTAAAWAWWDVGIRIGPRHTNYGDGSICSYEPEHRTWTGGDSLVTLLDLNSLWIARHLFLQRFGGWPGDQVLHTAEERLAEQRPGELCGCGSMRPYDECHRERDEALSAYDRFVEFRRRTPDPTRRIPEHVWHELHRLSRQRPAWECG